MADIYFIKKIVAWMRIITLASGILLGASRIFADGKWHIAKSLEKWLIRISLFFLLLLLLAEPGARTWIQYRTWAADPAAKFLLPPHQPWTYFGKYAFTHFVLWRLIGIVLAFVIFVLAYRFIVRPSEGFRMNRDEALLIAFGIALAGWPYCLIYLTALLILYALILLLLSMFRVVPRWLHRSGVPRGSAIADEAPRFPIALPATLALLIIPFANSILTALGLTVLRVTNLSV
jgi:hypothetical protein